MPLGFVPAFFALSLHSRAGLCRIVASIFSHEGGSHRIEQLLDPAAVLQSAFEHWHHIPGHIQAAPLSILGEGQQVVGMLVPAGAGRAIGANAGLTHLG